MAKQKRKAASYEWTGAELAVDFNDGGKVERFDFNDLPDKTVDGESLADLFLELGRKTKLSNFAASSKKEKRPRREMVLEGWAQLMDAKWAADRVGGGPTVSAEVEALAQIKDCSAATIQKLLRGYDADKRQQILGNARVVELANQIRAKRKEAEELEEVSLDDLA